MLKIGAWTDQVAHDKWQKFKFERSKVKVIG